MYSHNVFTPLIEKMHQRVLGKNFHQVQIHKTEQKGFTLVEIMIVLVIVGLLLGGALKTHEMVVNAKLKRIEISRADISTAVLAYKDRYKQLPGDHDSADQHFSIYTDGINDPLPAEINGNRNGTVDGSWNGAPNSETANFWKHLRAAELIGGGGDDDTQPIHAYGGNVGVRERSLLILGHVIIFGSIEGDIARILEDKLDDGAPATGFVQSDVTAALMDGTVASSSTNYLDTSRYFMAFSL